jgi:peptidoglycan/xylan/chitin deacetylase (PgdA/CDA1 family)
VSTARPVRPLRRPAQSWPFTFGVILITSLLLALGWSAGRGVFASRQPGAPERTPFYLPIFYSLGKYWFQAEADAAPKPTATPRPTRTHAPSPTPIATETPVPTDTPTATPVPPTYTPTPLPTPDGATRQLRVPILMYHYISEPPPDADIYRRDLSVSPQNFEAQLQWLAQNGYTPIRLYDLLYALTLGWPLPERPVILTFDDGYADAYEHAFPLLQKYGFKGTFFVVTEFVDRGLPGYLTWPQIEEMSAAGMDIEPHSKTHPDLRRRDHEFLIWQILGSAQTVAAHVGHTPRFFAYPAGHYDAAVLDVLKEIDMWGAVAVTQGTIHASDAPYELKRVRMRYTDSLPVFVFKLNWDF